ncbi:hypothetical protein ACE6H2_026245 [Prunus campanulata]
MGKKRNKKTLVWRPKPKSRTPQNEMRNWLDLPRDITISILSRLRAVEILESAQKVCMAWRNFCKDPLMWRTIDMANDGDYDDMFYDLDEMCRHAVDRSCSHLVDINIEHFGSNDLLEYITDSCGGIRRLRLVSCDMIFDEGLGKVASKLTMLEELEISLCNFSCTSLQVVGRSCPLLKSFKFNRSNLSDDAIGVFNYYDENPLRKDDEAFAIAGTMNGLHHLQLFANRLTNDGLMKILDCCPHLESLDLRHCFNLNLKGALGKRCAERIKQLRLPNDSIQDCEFRVAASDCDDYGFYDDPEEDNGFYYDPAEFDCDEYRCYARDFYGYDSDDSDFYDDFTKLGLSDFLF